jgi:hypothetical protein
MTDKREIPGGNNGAAKQAASASRNVALHEQTHSKANIGTEEWATNEIRCIQISVYGGVSPGASTEGQ